MAQDKKTKWVMLAEKLTNRVGLHRSITLPELKTAFVEFVEYYVDNPTTYYQRMRKKQKGSDKNKAEVEFFGDRVERVAPMTEHAFCLWIGKSKSWFPQTITNLKKLKDPNDEDREYLDFMLQLQTFFQSQLLEGAIIGDYNSNLITSLLGMKNNVDVTSDGKAISVPTISIVEDSKSREEYDAKN